MLDMLPISAPTLAAILVATVVTGLLLEYASYRHKDTAINGILRRLRASGVPEGELLATAYELHHSSPLRVMTQRYFGTL